MTGQPPTIERVTPAGHGHQVLSVRGGEGHQRQPCAQCPWRVDATGVFPPEAFIASAPISYDASLSQFACHSSMASGGAGVEGQELNRVPKSCAGFLLRGATHNLSARLTAMKQGPCEVSDGGHALHTNYRAMAVANGVPADHPALTDCRDDV